MKARCLVRDAVDRLTLATLTQPSAAKLSGLEDQRVNFQTDQSERGEDT
jgi:hypothetical protein